MSTYGFEELYETAETGTVAGIPEGVYNMKSVAVRVAPKIESRLLFIDLQVLDGPMAGKVGQANLFLPNPESEKYRGQARFFAKKIAGFFAYDDVKAAFAHADNAPSFEDALSLIADSLVEKAVKVDLGLVTEGQYKGNNEINSTEPPSAESLAAAPPVQVAQTAPTATAAPPVEVVQAAPAAEPVSNGQATPAKVPF